MKMTEDGFIFLENGCYFDLGAGFKAAWKATTEPFVVVDLETTGLDAEADEILEFSAVLAAPSGVILSEFSALVRVTQPMSDWVQELTGITEAEVEREGRPLAEAMKAFLVFVGSRPIFIHHASFDKAFLVKAAELTRQPFDNVVHDIEDICFYVWPGMRLNVDNLVKHLGLTKSGERCLDDSKAVLAILLATREEARLEAVQRNEPMPWD
jgi:DNA polymerase-3 subunit epsilon